MTDEQLDHLMRRVRKGDSEAQTAVDAWIQEALGNLCITGPLPEQPPGPPAAHAAPPSDDELARASRG